SLTCNRWQKTLRDVETCPTRILHQNGQGQAFSHSKAQWLFLLEKPRKHQEPQIQTILFSNILT
ncbi:hypothetical protein QMM85_17405, partial [Leptospira santarosai]